MSQRRTVGKVLVGMELSLINVFTPSPPIAVDITELVPANLYAFPRRSRIPSKSS